MSPTQIIIYTILLSGGIWSYYTKRLTATGSITGTVIGLLIFEATGSACFYMMTLFFVAGSAATRWQRNRKALMNAADGDKGRRTAWQVIANSGVAALLAILSLVMPNHLPIVQLAIAGTFAAATADTLSSELGTVYGKHFYNILTFKKEQRGLDGVVSIEGTLIGIVGASVIAAIYGSFFGWNVLVLCIIAAGFTGNLADSVLGAVLERKGLIGNNVVNFLNTAVGAGCCVLFNYFAHV